MAKVPAERCSYDAAMANRDPAFLWETEALRTSGVPARAPARQGSPDWLTLREASDATGLPLSTLRNWARKGRVPTALEESGSETHRMVSLEGVKARARQLGHDHEVRVEPATPAPLASPPEVQTPPPGTMLVPIDAWDKMLLQLGNLHQAGQQLAEARERAARAETEAIFLRERLAELREAVQGVPGPEPEAAAIEQEPPSIPDPQPATAAKMPRFSAYLWRMAASGRRRRA